MFSLSSSTSENLSMAYSPSEIDSLIMEAGVSGELAKLKEVKQRIGDDREFRRKCDVVNDHHRGRRVLHHAAKLGHFEICEFLVEIVRVNINVLNDRGVTPLMYAVKEEHVNIVDYLINQCALVGMSDSKGFTALHYAVQKDNHELIELLLMRGAPIEASSVDGTQLQCAALRGCVETVKFLLYHGAEPNSVSFSFGSPLICAIKSHSSECMELLLAAGADPNEFKFGLSPLAHAAKEGLTEFLNSLLEAGADPNAESTVGLRAIEEAALVLNVVGVAILFPHTERIPQYPNWSVSGISRQCHSEEAEAERERRRSDCLDKLDKSGKSAVKAGNYWSAIRSYSEAAFLDPSNIKWISNRSLCFVRVGKGIHGLRDAEECVRMDPKSAKAHYREGAAWKVLKNYHMSALAFKSASELAPDDEEIKEALGVAVLAYFCCLYLIRPVEILSLTQQMM